MSTHITGSNQHSCCSCFSIMYDLQQKGSTTEISTTPTEAGETSRTITLDEKVQIYKWYHPLIIFLRIFRGSRIDSFTNENTTIYCFKSDILAASRKFAGDEGKMANPNFTSYEKNNGKMSLVDFVAKIVQKMKTPQYHGLDDGGFEI